MTRLKTMILGGLVGAFVMIQFIQPDRNDSGQVSKQSLTALYHVPDNVTQILQQSCANCHSNNTAYPWYTHVQPVGWWMARHIRKGKAELNLDEFAGYSDRRRVSKLRSMKNQVMDGVMPLTSYTLIHRDARLSKEQKQQLVSWLDNTIDSLNQ
ncbi:hypothetical protein GCM10027566_24850 [Arachidicoccus ginsenosidivorans]|jgi:hypothetical protein|uniref:Haem-binding domain-containing protein n=2 Tax=Arachidicoccus TaxID=1769012 RepID=A0A1H4CRK8_9BACT|nr:MULTISPECIES: heme-binding domain-containing protein [Arachidicoccus]QEC71348.1 cytochrome C [Arachidicoccus ginsenosidivorans]SEA62938.1 Haem-binding domain-containing protein [Arachidicoccus rhizosphaerae]